MTLDLFNQAASRYGLDPGLLSTFARIESGGDPSLVNKYGYTGLFQFQPSRFRSLGGKNVFDPAEQTDVAAREFRRMSDGFAKQYGREPSPHELYMMHQQGEGGASAHWRNPSAPAWQNMLSTAEGRTKGENWAKRAIWDNIPNDAKARYGSVDNVTSADFTKLWEDKYNRLSGSPPANNAAVASALTGTSSTPTATGQPMTDILVTPEDLAFRRRLAAQLIGANDGSAVSGTGWGGIAQGLSRLVGGISGNMYLDQIRADERRNQQLQSKGLQDVLAPLAPQEAPARQAPVEPAAPALTPTRPPAGPAIGTGQLPSMPAPEPGAAPLNLAPGVRKAAPVPLASSPLTVGQDAQSRDKAAEFASLRALVTNPNIPLPQRLEMVKEFRAKWNPTDEQKLQRRLNELAITKAERELNDPSGKITVLPEGARAIVSDPRTGASRIIGQGAPKMSSTDKKAIYDAEDEIPGLDATISALERAKELNPKAYSGYTAGVRGNVMTGLEGVLGQSEAARATSEYRQLMNQQAIESMSRTLKGATTDREMAQFLSILSDLNQPADLRAQAIDRLKQLAEKQRAVKVARIQELRGGEAPINPSKQPPQAAPQIEDEKNINGKTYVKINGQWFEK